MKLSYYYQVTASGASSKELIINNGNSADWCPVVDDERALWMKYAVNGECIALKLVRGGVVIPVVKILGGGRPDNNVATWIYVPTQIIISGSELLSVIEEIRRLYQSGTKSVNEDSFTKNPILGKDYDSKRIPTTMRESVGNKLAYRTTGGDWSINEILGRPFQNYYSDYKFVLLFNQFPTDVDGIEDLSNKEIEDLVTVLPPSEGSLKGLFGDAQITIKLDNGSFTQPISRKRGTILHFTADRLGFIQRKFIGQVEDDEQEAQYSLSDKGTGWRKIISEQDFIVKDSATNKQIHGSKIHILNPEWDNKNKTLPEKTLKSVKLKIEANGYDTKEGTFDLSNGSLEVTIAPRKETAEYTYQTKDGRTLKISITGVGATSSSPLDGYRSKGKELYYDTPIQIYHQRDYGGQDYKKGSDHHQHYHKFAWKEFVYGILVALLVWGCYGLYQWLEPTTSYSSSNATYQTEGNSSISNQNASVESSLDQAIHYLDTNDKWQRDSLIKYSELDGLFEDLNQYNFDGLLKREDNLKNSNKFKELINVVKAHQSDSFSGSYCKDEDFEISINRYIDKIRQHTNVDKSSDGVASQTAKKAEAKTANPKTVSTAPKNTNNDKQTTPKRGNTEEQ
jgi:hypothetical protein